MSETITWTNDDDSDLTIVADTDTLETLKLNGASLLQPIQALRAEYARLDDRGNATNTIALAGKFAPADSPAEARAALVTLAAALRGRSNTGRVLEIAFAGATHLLADAALQPGWELEQRGTTVHFAFSFIGGEITTEETP